MKTKIALLMGIICVMVMTAGTANSQLRERPFIKGRNKEAAMANKEGIKESKEKIQVYVEKNVKPQMLEWKALIDKSLSKDDLNKLNDLRSKALTLREKNREEVKDAMAKIKSGDATKNDMTDLKEKLKSNMKEIGSQLKVILEANSDLTKKIAEAAKPKAENWRKDIMNILAENKIGEGRGKGPMGPGNNEHPGKMFLAKIFLWDGNSKLEGFFEMGGPNAPAGPNAKLDVAEFNVNVSPNPVTNSAKATFELPKKVNIKITVSDVYGRIMINVYSGEMTAGKHDIEFTPTKEMLNGAYVLKFETENGSFVKRFNVKK